MEDQSSTLTLGLGPRSIEWTKIMRDLFFASTSTFPTYSVLRFAPGPSAAPNGDTDSLQKSTRLKLPCSSVLCGVFYKGISEPQHLVH